MMRDLSEKAKAYNNIVIFGYGRFGQVLYNELISEYPDKSIMVCDNKISDSNKSIEIFSPQDIAEKYPNALYCLESKKQKPNRLGIIEERNKRMDKLI